MTFPSASPAENVIKTVRLDGKSVYIPEIHLTHKINPVITFLHVGSWTAFGTGKTERPLCRIDPKNNVIIIESPENLLGKPTKVVDRDTVNAFLDGCSWESRQVTHVAFKAVSGRRQPAVIEINTSAETVLFSNGKFACDVRAGDAKTSGGIGYFPIMLNEGENVINIKQYSFHEKPRFQMTVYLDNSRDLRAAWQPQHGLLKKLVYALGDRADPITLDWNPNLSKLFVSLEVRDVSTNKIVLQRNSVRRGKVTSDTDAVLAPGIYEATYRAGNESASEFFIVGNPAGLFAGLQDKLSQYSQDSAVKFDIQAQFLRAKILLAKENYNVLDRQWQEKTAYTLSSLATIERKLKEGIANIPETQSGILIRSFASGADGSTQSYRLFIPSSYNPAASLPLLVIPSTRIEDENRSFIEGPAMANQRQALLWAKSAEKHGFALLWPGYRGAPDGYTYESVNIDEAIHAVEKDYNIDPHRISVYATCGAGYNAGRLVTEYPVRFAAIVYDLAVFDLSLESIQFSPSLMQWYTTVNPSRHVIDNQNLRIFVMHDNTKPAGHGPLELSTAFLSLAAKTRGDIASLLNEHPMTLVERLDKTFSWLAPCRNENPGDTRSRFLAKAGFTGPIMEIFATPMLVVEGTHATGGDLENIQRIVGSIKTDYSKYFHGAQCAIKKDTEVTQDEIDSHSLILVGNPQSNSVWEKIQAQIPMKVTLAMVLYKNDRLTGNRPFQAIVPHPTAESKYILMIGAGDLRTLDQVPTGELFTAWYDCKLLAPEKIISKLSALRVP